MFYLIATVVVIALAAGGWLYMRIEKRRSLALEQKQVDDAYEQLVAVLDPNATRATAAAFNDGLPGSIDRLDGSLREDAVPEVCV